MTNLNQQLTDLLLSDERLKSQEGQLLKNLAQELARKNDPKLISLLLSEQKIKDHFFIDIKATLIFDKEKFIRFISSRQFLPDSYTAYKNKIGLTIDDEYIIENKNVVLVWPYKDCILEGGMTKDDQKRDEIFHNENLAPDEVNRLMDYKVFANFNRVNKNGKSKLINFRLNGDGKIKDNLIIKGNNLIALSSLRSQFEGKIKCIYIDPPYFFNKNKESDSFSYNSNFSLSTWLVFMKNRLECSKPLLKQGGTIWISISEDGMHYLKILADGIFGKEHFIGTIPRRTRNGKSDVPFNFSQDFDWLLCYTNVDESNSPIGRQVDRKYYESEDLPGQPWRLADATSQRTAEERPNSYFTMINPKNGKEYPASEKRTWAVTQDTFDYYYHKGAIVFPGDYEFLEIGKPYFRKFKSEDENAGKYSAIISDFQIKDFLEVLLSNAKNKEGNNEIDALFGREAFGYAKPESLIKAIIEVATDEEDIILDFYLGSGTTAAVAHKMNRQYIGIEQMDYIEAVSLERLKRVISGEQGGISKSIDWQGGGDFVYMELAKWNQIWIEKIEETASSDELIQIWEEMNEEAFLSYKVDPKTISESAKDFKDLSTSDQKKFLIECLDKNHLYINYSEIEDQDYGLSEEEIRLNREFYK